MTAPLTLLDDDERLFRDTVRRFAREQIAPHVRVRVSDSLEMLGAEGWEAFATVPAALDGYAYAVTDGVHVLLRRSTLVGDDG